MLVNSRKKVSTLLPTFTLPTFREPSSGIRNYLLSIYSIENPSFVQEIMERLTGTLWSGGSRVSPLGEILGIKELKGGKGQSKGMR